MGISSWTAERENLLIDLKHKGLSASEIGARLGSTRNSVLGKLHRMGLATPLEDFDFWTDQEVEVLKKEWNTGKSVTEIGQELFAQCGKNRTNHGIVGKAERLGLVKRMTIKVKLRSTLQYDYAASEEGVRKRLAEHPSLNIPFFDLQEFHCREITGTGPDGLASYCGHPRQTEKSYCEFHQSVNCHVITPVNRVYYRG